MGLSNDLHNVPGRIEPGHSSLAPTPFNKNMLGSREIFYISKDFSDTDIHHSDIKKCVNTNFKFFLLAKNHFSKLAKTFNAKCL